MNNRMQCFDAATEYLREAGQVGNVRDLEPGVGKQLRRTAGGHEFDPQRRQPTREIDDTRLVEYRNQCPTDYLKVCRGWQVLYFNHGSAAFFRWSGR